jgi:hypothetical protein
MTGRRTYILYRWESQKERDHQEEQALDGRIIIKKDLVATKWSG